MAGKKTDPPRPTRAGGATRARGLRALGETVDRLTGPLIGTQRLLAADLALAWGTLAGERLAAATHPDRLVFPPKRREDGTLHLRAASGAAALELQHETRRLIDRINAHLGFAGVARLKVVQAPLPPARPRAFSPDVGAHPPTPLPSDAPTENETAEFGGEVLTGIEDERLRAALAGLGRRVLAKPAGADPCAPSGEACPDDGEPV